MIVTIGMTITKIAQVAPGDIIFNTGVVPVYVDTVQSNVINAPLSSATPVQPGSSIQWAGTAGLLYGKDPTGSNPGIGVTAQTGLPFPAPVGGPNFYVSPQGFLFYTSTPALDDLFASITSTSGTDKFGNPFGTGFVVYGTGPTGPGTAQIGFTVSGSIPVIGFASGAASEARNTEQVVNVFNPNLASESISFAILGPEGTASPEDFAGIQLVSSPANAAGEATGFLQYNNSERLAWGAGRPSVYTPGGMNGPIALTETDNFNRSFGDTTTVTPITVAYTIPAGDFTASNPQRSYMIDFACDITDWNSGGDFFIQFMGSANIGFFGGYSAAFFTAGHTARFYGELTVYLTSSTSFNVRGWVGSYDVTAAGNTSIFTCNLTGETCNMAVAGSYSIAWQFNAAHAGESIACPGSELIVKGP